MDEGTVAKGLADIIALHHAGKYAQTEASCVELLKSQPQNVDLWNLRGVNFRKLKRPAEAIRCLRRGITLAPDNATLWSNLGNVLNDVRQCEAAVACHRRATARHPTVTGLHNLGIALSATGREREAIEAYDRALALAPGNPDVMWDRALSQLRLGDFAAGWAGYEARQQRSSWVKRVLPGRPWRGERYDGARLLVASEQGLGDTIWVARYFHRVKELGGELIIECRPELVELIAAMGVADHIVAKSDSPPEADLHVQQCSLPGILNSTAEPYLAAAPRHIEKLATAFGPHDGRLRVGIIWGGSPTYEGRAHRDAALGGFLRWLALPHVQLYSLQKGPQAEDLAKLPPHAPIIDLGVHTANLPETAGAIAHLDLVVMTDTCVAHLCGAMGKPVWLLLNRVPHFLWQLDRSDTPWYPSMRLFRQKSWGDWNGVFDSVAAALISTSPAAR